MAWLALVVFWTCTAALAYGLLVYPLLLRGVSGLAGRESRKQETGAPVAVVMAVHNGEADLPRKLETLQRQDHAGPVRVYLGLDACTDATAAIAGAAPNAHVTASAARIGKSAMLNLLMRDVTEDIVVFTDVRQELSPGAVRELASHFADSTVGVVAGEYEMVDDATGAMLGVDWYWRYERFLRRHECRIGGSIGVSGALYALRRAAWRPIPDDAWIDDVAIPLGVRAQGLRIAYEPAARAMDRFSRDWMEEDRRKIRTLAGNWQMIFGWPRYGNPLQPRLLFAYLSHKGFRLAMPLLLAGAFAANACLVDQIPYRMFFGLQCLGYGLALLGLAGAPAHMWRGFRVLSTFLKLNQAVILGLRYYLRHHGARGWETT